MKNLLICLIVVAALFLAGCPKAKNTYRSAKEASAKIQIYGIKLINANMDAFRAGEIDQPTFAELTRLTGRFVDGVEIYRTALAEAEKFLQQNGTIPADTLSRLNFLFNEQVVDAFLAITQKFGVLPEANSELVKTILAGIRLAVLTIADAFSAARAFQLRSEQWT